jgi:UDP-GlcNAc3NAcA epimerase
VNILTIIGARPQFIKAAVISRMLRSNDQKHKINELIVHTGQHFDDNMSKFFFEELDIPKPKYNLDLSGGSQGKMTGRMLEAIERVLLKEKPDWVLIYGDTNSTLAGALAAAKLHIPIAHIEAGLRSFNLHMPEEINRVIVDRVSTLLFCPTHSAVDNLKAEGILKGVYLVGDVMYDASLFYRDIALQRSRILKKLGLESGEYVLATCHRAENTDDPIKLIEILTALLEISSETKVVLPLHPRTKKAIKTYGLDYLTEGLIVSGPLAFIDMVALEQGARVIITDSGGVQKEAFFYGVPCITTRDETEWVETVQLGFNQLTGADKNKIYKAYLEQKNNTLPSKTFPYGIGEAASQIIRILENI